MRTALLDCNSVIISENTGNLPDLRPVGELDLLKKTEFLAANRLNSLLNGTGNFHRGTGNLIG